MSEFIINQRASFNRDAFFLLIICLLKKRLYVCTVNNDKKQIKGVRSITNHSIY